MYAPRSPRASVAGLAPSSKDMRLVPFSFPFGALWPCERGPCGASEVFTLPCRRRLAPGLQQRPDQEADADGDQHPAHRVLPHLVLEAFLQLEGLLAARGVGPRRAR